MSAYSVTHVVFDMDGLLLDTEKLYTVATQNVVSKVGKVFTPEIKVKQMGKNAEESSALIIRELDLPYTVEELRKEMKKEFEALFPYCTLMPGAARLVHHLHSHNIPMCVATASSELTFNMKTQNHGDLFSMFHHVVLGSSDPEVKRGKPHPDIFQVAASRFNPPAKESSEILVFEDAANGVLSAKAAGMLCVMVPDHTLPIPSEVKGRADQVLTSLDKFQPEIYGLPPYSSSA